MSQYEDELAKMMEYGAAQDVKRATAPTADQGTPEWLAERVGHGTASRFKDTVDTLKNGKSSAKRDAYLWELVVERLTKQPAEHYVSAPMEWGTEQQPAATMAYESATGAMVEQVGFLHHKEIKWVGGSPDGLVGDDGMIEIKAPNSTTHAKTIFAQSCEHMPQIQGLLWITGRKWCDFVSFDPRMPAGLQLYIQRIARDEDYIAQLAGGVMQFLKEVDDQHALLMEIAHKAA